VIDAMRERSLARIFATLVVSALIVLLAGLIPSQPALALGVAALLLVAGVAFTAPTLLLAAIFAATFGYWRVGPSGLNMSIADALTALALVAAMPFVPWKSRSLRRLLIAIAAYQGLTLMSVLASPTHLAVGEWFHRMLLFGGAILVGAAVAHRRQTSIALRGFIFAAGIVSVAAIASSLTHGFSAGYPFGMQKNFAGPLLAMSVVLIVVVPWRLELRPSFVRHLRILLVIGLVATQSRGAGLALVAVIAIYAARHRSARRRAPIFFLLVSLTLIVGSVVSLRSDTINNPKFNGVDTRESAFDVALNDVWEPHPFVGGGLRWFAEPGRAATQPHNIVVSELAEIGLIGLFGLVILATTTVVVLFRRRDPIGEAAFLVFVFILLFSMTGIFWLAGSLTLPMLVVGLAVGEDAASVRTRSQDVLTPSAA
jgi:hypothetical protein